MKSKPSTQRRKGAKAQRINKAQSKDKQENEFGRAGRPAYYFI
jgi:hypothetical protein